MLGNVSLSLVQDMLKVAYAGFPLSDFQQDVQPCGVPEDFKQLADTLGDCVLCALQYIHYNEYVINFTNWVKVTFVLKQECLHKMFIRWI